MLLLGDYQGARSPVAAAQAGAERLLGSNRAAMASSFAKKARRRERRRACSCRSAKLSGRQSRERVLGGDEGSARRGHGKRTKLAARASFLARRHASRVRATTPPPRSTVSRRHPRRVQRPPRYATTSSTRTTTASGLRSPISGRRMASDSGRASARAGALALGYWSIVEPVYRAQRGYADARALTKAFGEDCRRREGRLAAVSQRRVEHGLDGFRAAPLTEDELVRRAGQLDRFLQLVPIEYGRGVSDGRVTLDFEIQEAVTFRDGAETALRPAPHADRHRRRSCTGAGRRPRRARGRAGGGVARRHGRLADTVAARTDEALALVSSLYPERWKEAAKTADFDVIAATLDRLQEQPLRATGRGGTRDSRRTASSSRPGADRGSAPLSSRRSRGISGTGRTARRPSCS